MVSVGDTEELRELIEYLYQSNPNVFSTKYMNNILSNAGDSTKNVSIIIGMLHIQPNIYEYLHADWKKHGDIIVAMAKINSRILREIDKKLFADRKFVKKCLSTGTCPWIFPYLPEADKMDVAYVVELLSIEGWIYIHLEDDMKTQQDVIPTALRETNGVLWPWIRNKFPECDSVESYYSKYCNGK